jgi:acyl-CoA thioester hydrolase
LNSSNLLNNKLVHHEWSIEKMLYLCKAKSNKKTHTMYIHKEKIRVRYGETDKMGYVYHGNYPLYYEQARTEMMRALGLPYTELEAQNIMMPLIELNIKYYHPAVYDDVITVETSIAKMPTAKIEFAYRLYNEQQQLLNEGTTVLAFINAKTRHPCRPPQCFINQLKNLLS